MTGTGIATGLVIAVILAGGTRYEAHAHSAGLAQAMRAAIAAVACAVAGLLAWLALRMVARTPLPAPAPEPEYESPVILAARGDSLPAWACEEVLAEPPARVPAEPAPEMASEDEQAPEIPAGILADAAEQRLKGEDHGHEVQRVG
jgi:hypothetical protein